MGVHKSTAEEYLTRRMPSVLKRVKTRKTEFGGAETLPACEENVNLSPRRLPGVAVRRPRGLLMSAQGSGTPHGMVTFNGDLYVARGTELYRKGDDGVTLLGEVSDTDKRFFVFGERLYVYPDKLYVQAGDPVLYPLELDSGVLSEKSVFEEHTVTLPRGMIWKGLGFSPGDCVWVVNADDEMPAPEGFYRIVSQVGRVATVAERFPAVYESCVRLRRVVPDLERVCVSGDRVYGIAGRDVYISAAGSAMDFYSPGSGNGQNGAVLRLSSDGEITACAVWQGYVIFFKRNSICKLLGSRSDNFTLQERPAVGIAPELADALCEVGGDLYYPAQSGVYRYRGQEPERISPVGDARPEQAVGGTDGVAYYLAICRQGEWRQYCYLPADGSWFAEDNMHPRCMIRWKDHLCVQDADGRVWITSSDGWDIGDLSDERELCGPVRGSLILPPDYELQPDGCRLTGVALRLSGEALSDLEVFAEYADGAAGRDADGGSEVFLGGVSGKMTDRLVRFPVTPRVSDGVRIRLAMTGDWVVHAVIREYEV